MYDLSSLRDSASLEPTTTAKIGNRFVVSNVESTVDHAKQAVSRKSPKRVIRALEDLLLTSLSPTTPLSFRTNHPSLLSSVLYTNERVYIHTRVCASNRQPLSEYSISDLVEVKARERGREDGSVRCLMLNFASRLVPRDKERLSDGAPLVRPLAILTPIPFCPVKSGLRSVWSFWLVLLWIAQGMNLATFDEKIIDQEWRFLYIFLVFLDNDIVFVILGIFVFLNLQFLDWQVIFKETCLV